ncbi:MAG TPA: DUF1648 domain-containing protein [Casimicrobiaceae bacterium]|nr:DUF1648 domain-containing protein [Casimicrobiaceae bacterium]
MIQLARPLFVLLLVVTAILIGVTTERMPAQIASHFGANGRANAFMDQDTYRMFMLAFAVGIPVLVVLVAGVLPRRLSGAINLPNREYWLAPARRDDTLRYLESHAYWLGSLLVVFMAAMHLLLIAANASQPPSFPGRSFVMLMVAFLLVTGIWMATLFLHFRRSP